MELSKDLAEFIRLFNQNRVEYLIVGGWAAGFHSIPRFTGDIDIFIRATTENAQRILKVLAEFGFGSLNISVEDLTRPNYVIQLGKVPNRIDLLTSLTSVKFEDAWPNRVCEIISGEDLVFIGREDLKRNKIALGRPRDLMDVDALERTEKTIRK